jgi:alpha-1,2-glucosyltransferase
LCLILFLPSCSPPLPFLRIAHPFLLADNRHYTFYIWKNFFLRFNWFRFALIPVYLVSFYFCWNSLALSTNMTHSPFLAASRSAFRILFFFIVALCLIPTPLVEFRYFITPFYIYSLHLHLCHPNANEQGPVDPSSLSTINPSLFVSKYDILSNISTILFYLLLNIASLYVFIYKPFIWPDGSIARFMW